jgi:hypothetical protein
MGDRMGSYNKIILLFFMILPLFTGSMSVVGLQTAYAGDPGECTTHAECSFLDDACFMGICESGFCVADPGPLEGQQCGPGDVCNFEVCQGGSCVPDPTPLEGETCGDSDACNDAICQGGSCALVPANDGLECGPGDVCTIDVCQGGSCVVVHVDGGQMCLPIGGTVGSMSTTSLLVAGAQSNMGLWSLALVGIVGAAAAITYKVKSKSEQ